jgi:hypothetical protein
MTDMKDSACFEFGKSENEALSSLSRSLHRLGIVVLAGGILFVVYLVLSFVDPKALLVVSDTKSSILAVVDYALWIVIALLLVYLSIMVLRLAKPIRLITETTGADMGHLMEFVGDLTRLSQVCFWGIVAICLLIVASLGLLVLVF